MRNHVFVESGVETSVFTARCTLVQSAVLGSRVDMCSQSSADVGILRNC